jgi:hypothetical protein
MLRRERPLRESLSRKSAAAPAVSPAAARSLATPFIQAVQWRFAPPSTSDDPDKLCLRQSG